MGVFYPQSKGPWFSKEFQAACIESYRAVAEGRYTWVDVQQHVENVPRFETESAKRGFPSWEQIRKWARESPNLPEEVRGKDFLSDFKPLQLETKKPVPSSLGKADALVNLPQEAFYPIQAPVYRAQPDTGWYSIMQQMIAMMAFICIFSFCSSILRSSTE